MSDLEKLDLSVRAELLKLARVLEIPAGSIAELGAAGAGDLQRLRRRISYCIHEERRDAFRRLAALVRVLPTRYAAHLAEHALGPALSARLVGELHPVHASKVAQHVSPGFIAELAPEVDPERVQDLVPQLPAELIRDVALLLVEAGDHITLGRFADALSPPQLRAVVAAIDSDATLLRVAFFVEKRSQLSKVIYNIDNDRIARIMRSAATQGLLPEALSIIDNVADDLKARLGNLMGAQDVDVLNALVDIAWKQRLWGPILRGMAHMHPRYQRRIVNLPAVKNEALLGDLVQAAYDEDLFEQALPLVRSMRPEFRRIVAHAALSRGEDIAEAVLRAAQRTGSWSLVLDLARYTDDAERDMLAGLDLLQRDDVLEDAVSAIDSEGRAAVALDIFRRLDAGARRRVADLIAADYAMPLDALLDVVDGDAEHLETIAAVLALLDEPGLRAAGEVLAARDAGLRRAVAEAARRAGVLDRLAPYLSASAA